MRIRKFRQEDLSALVTVQQASARYDGLPVQNEREFVQWLAAQTSTIEENTFVVTDDDDELNTWGQAGTLEGIEGEIIGYTVVRMVKDQEGYHLVCRGSVAPEHRRRHAGRALLICALNRAHLMSSDFDFEAEQAGIPVYFEAWLPTNDEGARSLAERSEMQAVQQHEQEKLTLYRRILD